jgi:hypothetical protein
MVEYNAAKAQVPVVLDDVRKITVDLFGFMKENEEFLFSKPEYLSAEKFSKEFREFFSEENGESYTAFIAFRDGNVYLNHDRLNDEQHGPLFENWLFAILAWGHPYSFAAKETEYGRQLPKKTERVNAGSNLLAGVCKAVEIDALKKSGKYDSRKVESELLKDIMNIKEDEEYAEQKIELKEGYEIAREIQSKLEKCQDEMDEVTKARILKAVIKTAGKNKNFDTNLRVLKDLEIHYIYRKAGAKILEPSQYVVEVEEMVDNIFKLIGSDDYTTRQVVSEADRTLDRYYMQIGGSPDIFKQGKDTLKRLTDYPDYNPRAEIPDLYKGEIIKVLNDLKDSLKEIKKRKRKIEFR